MLSNKMHNYKMAFEKTWSEVMENKPKEISTPSDCLPLLGEYRNKDVEYSNQEEVHHYCKFYQRYDAFLGFYICKKLIR